MKSAVVPSPCALPLVRHRALARGALLPHTHTLRCRRTKSLAQTASYVMNSPVKAADCVLTQLGARGAVERCVRGWCAARVALHRSPRASLARLAMPAAGRARGRCRAGAWRVMVAEIWTRRTARTARLERAPVWRANGVWEGGGPRESRAAPRVWTGGASGGVSGRQRQIRGAASANTCNNLHAPCRADPRARSEHLEAAREAVCRGAAARRCSVSKRRSRRRRGGGRARGIGEKN